jgi:bifunctional DNA-binding transcriptional regulator/antitoxin component of YhaV-PrlF toxin-antitoxin module
MPKNKRNKSGEQHWELTVDDDGVVVLPEDFLEQTGWREGDSIEFVPQADGTWHMERRDDLFSTIERVPSSDRPAVSMTVAQVRALASSVEDLDQDATVELFVSRDSGIGPSLRARVPRDIDLTDYHSW